MANENAKTLSPNDALTELVVFKLKEKGLISQDKIVEVTNKMRAGTASRGDWKLWIDLAKSAKPKGGDNAKN